MKKITLPDVTFSIQVPGTDGGPPIIEMIGAAEQLRLVISFPTPGQTFTIDEIRSRLPLVAKLQRAKGKTILLEDEEHSILMSAMGAASWSAVSINAVALHEAVEKAETVEVKLNRKQRRQKTS